MLFPLSHILSRLVKKPRSLRVALAMVPAWSVDTPPLGLACIAASLRRAGHKVRVFDGNVTIWRAMTGHGPDMWGYGSHAHWENEERFENATLPLIRPHLDALVEEILAGAYDVAGFAVFNTSIYTARYTATAIRRKNPSIRICYGGPAALAFKLNDVLYGGILDAAVCGEGERTVLDLLDAWSQGRSPAGLPGVIARNQAGQAAVGSKPKPVPVNRLPRPDFDGFDLSLYRQQALPIMMSRGCVGHCAFCTETRFWNPYRSRPPESVFEELKAGVEQYGVANFAPADSLMNGDHGRLEALVDMILDSGLRIRWGGYARVDKRLTRDLLHKMAAAGCAYLSFGLETASQKVLDLMNKGTTVFEASRVVRSAHEAGIQVHVNLIVGFPGEEEDDLRQTMEFLREHKDCIHVVNTGQTLGLSPDMALWDKAREFSLATDSRGVPLVDEAKGWTTVDGSNTLPVRRKRLDRVRCFLEENGINYNPKM